MKTNICPYPGLRPFTEEESIFFKGRDLHIRQIVKLLEENKMVFITGASGDGKSSMVYAGVVPYIRAGFFKADFNSWIIADFKPQRNPLASLALSIAQNANLDYDTCLEELSHGFSSVIDLYKKNGFYVTEGDNAANQGKNLLIIADQFEEVFTNSDNFNNGIPSEECYTTINLLLETVRIAVTQKLPVYVAFTMRSDFISQCTVFKHLPEFIAYSQFFVPQLKRTEICQVIEEPATLAGGSVSPRLTEVIVNNINDGADQLPVLQHALNLLWKMADNGKKQLDLLHLAKIAGISRDVLSDEEQKDFDQWFAKLPDYEKKYFEKPDLNNVLNAHAGILYESAYDHFQQNASWAPKNITREESKQIIETVFKSLVKIDNNRPVRNRSTLDEITGMINKDNVNNATVCGVINIFRSPENTLLRPFSEPDNFESQYLSGDTVLDITHEALIRNWKMLASWGYEMENNQKDFYDFDAQVKRWLHHEQSAEYLLPTGSYNYFNDWYQKSRPNAYWLARYDNSKISEKEKIEKATTHFENCIDYIEASKKAILEKEEAKKRKFKTIIAVAIAFIVTMLLFSGWAMREKSKAEDSQKLAEIQRAKTEEKRLEAETERQKANDAQEAAEIAAQNARDEEQKARLAQQATERALLQANEERSRAEKAEKQALSNLLRAETGERNAKDAQERAERGEKDAKMAKDSSERLYDITLCNMLAMNAKNQYEDKELNLKLAWAAYKLSEKRNIRNNDAILYDAMLYAIEQQQVFDNILKDVPKNISTFKINNANQICLITNDAQISTYALGANKAKLIKTFNVNENKAPVLKAILLSDKYALVSMKDKSIYFVDIDNKKSTQLKTIKDYVTAATFTSDQKHIILSFNNGKILVLNPYEPKEKPLHEFTSQSKVSEFCIVDNNIYLATHTSELMKWNPETGEATPIYESPGNYAFALTSIPDKNLIVIGVSNGNVVFFNTKNDKQTCTKVCAHSQIENMFYDKNTQLLAVASADKRISLIDTKDIENSKILNIEDHALNGFKVKNMSFNTKGMIFALTEDKLIRFWNTDIKSYARILKTFNQKLDPLSAEEKELILGKEFSKEEL